jgi:hypothetical protein
LKFDIDFANLAIKEEVPKGICNEISIKKIELKERYFYTIAEKCGLMIPYND